MKFIKNSIYIFKTDWSRILKNPLTLIIISGLMLLPSLYAWFNIQALWDPYGNASNLPIGVYSDDTGVRINNQYINIGTEIINNLKNDDNLDWQIPNNYDELANNVNNGTYYGSIYIPENFSQQITGILNGNYEKAHIEYRVNEKINAIAPKMTEAGAQGISLAITEGFNKIASETVLQLFNNIGVDFANNIPMFYNLFSSIDSAAIKADKINEFLEQIHNLNIQFNDPSNISDYLNENDITTDLNNLANFIHTLNSYMPKLLNMSDNINYLDENSNDIKNIQQSIYNLYTLLNDLEVQINNLENNPNFSKQNIDKLIDFINSNDFSSKGLTTYLESLELTIEDIQNVFNNIITIVDDSLNLLQLLATNISNITSNLANYLTNNSLTPAQIVAIQTLLTNLNTTLTTASNTLTNIINILNLILGPSNSIVITLTTINNNISNLQNDITYIINNINSLNLNTVITNLNNIASAANQIVNNINSIDISYISHELNSILNNILEKIEKGEQISFDLNSSNIQQLLQSITNLFNIINTFFQNTNIDFSTLQNNLNNINNFLNNNIDSYIASIHTLNNFWQNKLPTIATNINNIDIYLQNNSINIYDFLNNSADYINNNIGTLQNTLEKINTFYETKWANIYTSLHNLQNTTNDIKESKDLEKIANALITDIKKGSDFIAKPIQTDTIQMYPVANYGSASSPFYTALCLWVGSVLLTSLLSTRFHNTNKNIKLTNREIFLGRFLTFAFIGIIQALIVSLGNLYLLHVSAISPFYFILFTIIISISFNAIVYTIVNLFGNVGKAIAVVLLVLSISGGGGNFPIQVSGKFFQIINPILPFTHAVNLLREPIGGIYLPTVYISIFILSIYALVFLLLGLFGAHYINPILLKLEEKSHKSHIFH